MPAGEPTHVYAGELMSTLRYGARASLNYLMRIGAIAEPERVTLHGRRHARWPRAYVDALLRNPPPLIATRLGRAADSGSAYGSAERSGGARTDA